MLRCGSDRLPVSGVTLTVHVKRVAGRGEVRMLHKQQTPAAVLQVAGCTLHVLGAGPLPVDMLCFYYQACMVGAAPCPRHLHGALSACALKQQQTRLDAFFTVYVCRWHKQLHTSCHSATPPGTALYVDILMTGSCGRRYGMDREMCGARWVHKAGVIAVKLSV